MKNMPSICTNFSHVSQVFQGIFLPSSYSKKMGFWTTKSKLSPRNITFFTRNKQDLHLFHSANKMNDTFPKNFITTFRKSGKTWKNLMALYDFPRSIHTFKRNISICVSRVIGKKVLTYSNKFTGTVNKKNCLLNKNLI